MVTQRDDDYLICRHYYDHINDVSKDYPDFITFQHNDNHFFAWVNDGKVVLRSEAYPDEERMIRGIKAIIKNWDMPERYSVDSAHGAHFLVLWGGGDHEKHTGNFASHNEIGRSCPTTNKDDLYNLLLFKGKDFAGRIVNRGVGGVEADIAKPVVAAATTAVASLASKADNTIAATSNSGSQAKAVTTASTGRTANNANDNSGGFKWWWILPLLLLPLLFFLWKGCDKDKAVEMSSTTTGDASITTPEPAAANIEDTAAGTEAETDVAAMSTVDTDASRTASAGAEIESVKESTPPPPPPVPAKKDTYNPPVIGDKNSGF